MEIEAMTTDEQKAEARATVAEQRVKEWRFQAETWEGTSRRMEGEREAAERALAEMQAQRDVLVAFVVGLTEPQVFGAKTQRDAMKLVTTLPASAVRYRAVVEAAKEAYGEMTDYLCMQNPSFERLCAAVAALGEEG
jgi:hypothetical protein